SHCCGFAGNPRDSSTVTGDIGVLSPRTAVMPGGLAAWLDDPIDTKLKPKREKNVLQHIKLHRGVQPREATAAAAAATTTAAAAAARQPLTATATDSPNFPIIDVDAVMPCASAVGPGKTTSLA
ncbi:unnamed protein product, partial [Laminaria digitata]